MPKPALGRGLGALLGGSQPASSPAPDAQPAAPGSSIPTGQDPVGGVRQIATNRVHPCPFQPRKSFSETSLQELADSIREQGIVQPLIVRPRGDDFELIAGERRWRAAQRLGLSHVPVIVREANDAAVLELALIENLQRENLNPIEEALGYSQLIEQFGLTQEQAAGKVGKSRALVANALRLLRLAPDVQNEVRDGRLSVGHAKVILGLDSHAAQKQAADRILKQGLNVRQTEEWIARLQKGRGARASNGAQNVARDVHSADLEGKLQERLGTKVQLRYHAGKGSVEIRFYNDDDLGRILKILGIDLD